jgi:hypothetical protein
VINLILAVTLMFGTQSVREPARVGSFYPAQAATLASDVAGYFQKAGTPVFGGHVLAVVSPHAGYAFSGATAAKAFAAVKGGDYTRVILMGTGHAAYNERGAVLAGWEAWSMPGGNVNVDLKAVKDLAGKPGFKISNRVHQMEHSLEVQLPFLQAALKNFTLIPFVLGGQTQTEDAFKIAEELKPYLGDKTLVVVSTDFTHYGPNYQYVPFRDDVPKRMKALDLGVWDLVLPGNPGYFDAFMETTQASVCGERALLVLCALLPADSQRHFIAYTSSGEILNDYENAVGYLAGVFTGSWGKTAAPPASKPHRGTLTDEEKKQLVKLARATLRSHVLSDDSLSRFLREMKATEGMMGISGVFVTYKIHEDLRGCIGSIEGREPLWLGVVHNACSAASHDPRFRPVGPPEVDAIALEVSVLTPLKPIRSVEEITMGKHGVVLHKGGAGAVFLPQVATETGWSRDEFLSHLAQKAGLRSDDWKQGATFETFEAIVIHE